MEIKPSVTVVFTQEELLKALESEDAARLFEQAREDRTLIDVGNVDREQITRTIVGPPHVMRQIFSALVKA